MRLRIKEAVDSYVSMAALARQIGVSKSTVSQWVHGQIKNLQADHLYKLAQVTGYSARWLLEGIEPKMQSELTGSQVGSSTTEQVSQEIGERKVCDVSVAELVKYIQAAG